MKGAAIGAALRVARRRDTGGRPAAYRTELHGDCCHRLDGLRAFARFHGIPSRGDLRPVRGLAARRRWRVASYTIQRARPNHEARAAARQHDAPHGHRPRRSHLRLRRRRQRPERRAGGPRSNRVRRISEHAADLQCARHSRRRGRCGRDAWSRARRGDRRRQDHQLRPHARLGRRHRRRGAMDRTGSSASSGTTGDRELVVRGGHDALVPEVDSAHRDAARRRDPRRRRGRELRHRCVPRLAGERPASAGRRCERSGSSIPHSASGRMSARRTPPGVRVSTSTRPATRFCSRDSTVRGRRRRRGTARRWRRAT